MYLDILAKKLEQKRLNDEKAAGIDEIKNQRHLDSVKNERDKFNDIFGAFMIS